MTEYIRTGRHWLDEIARRKTKLEHVIADVATRAQRGTINPSDRPATAGIIGAAEELDFAFLRLSESVRHYGSVHVQGQGSE